MHGWHVGVVVVLRVVVWPLWGACLWVVFKGPVHRTGKRLQLNRTELQKTGPSVAVRASWDGRTALNRTDKDRFESVQTATRYSS
jgi:hypothetical protein